MPLPKKIRAVPHKAPRPRAVRAVFDGVKLFDPAEILHDASSAEQLKKQLAEMATAHIALWTAYANLDPGMTITASLRYFPGVHVICRGLNANSHNLHCTPLPLAPSFGAVTAAGWLDQFDRRGGMFVSPKLVDALHADLVSRMRNLVAKA